MKSLPEFIKKNSLAEIFKEQEVQDLWETCFKKTYAGEIDTWDYQWTYAVFSSNGLCINPNHNLVTNIGGGLEATHTKDANNPNLNLAKFEIGEIVHPIEMICDRQADLELLHRNFGIKKIRIFKKIIKNLWLTQKIITMRNILLGRKK